ncbi:MAG: iron-containing alcohol dehydrogenase, partial [Muribaculaceae bacterium]|nr:iron-containing alcohol dehydrogenase [Muribaculaceae bacterium]
NVENRRVAVIADSCTEKLFGDEVCGLLKEHCRKVILHSFPAGESNKTLDTVRDIYKALIEEGFDRKDLLIALGGGVVGDVTGYAAATYLRGIDFVQIPTTLIAQSDSSIGGKTGVDFDGYKNMVGAFYMPKLVYMNVSVLKKLDEFVRGLGHVLTGVPGSLGHLHATEVADACHLILTGDIDHTLTTGHLHIRIIGAYGFHT